MSSNNATFKSEAGSGERVVKLPGLRCAAFLLIAVFAGGCSASSPTFTVGAADPGSGTVAPSYEPVLSGYVPSRPTDPKPWREINARTAPKGGKP